MKKAKAFIEAFDGVYESLADKYQHHTKAANEALAGMEKVSASLLKDLFEHMSLREVARRTDRSPTYISQVANGKAKISPQTYLRLVELWKDLPDL